MERIKWITQAIAQPCEVQKGLFPSFVNVADELAIEWESSLLDLLQKPSILSLFTQAQLDTIYSLDSYMATISGEKNIQYWDNIALCSCIEWEKMRNMAKDILWIMSWPNIVPEKDQDIYINEHGVFKA